MAFLSCRKCGWSQDDFWHPDNYHPFRRDIVEWLVECLFKPVVTTADDTTHRPVNLSGKEYVARSLERMARQIRDMHWPTEEAWKADPNRWECPNCKANGLSVD